MISLEKNKIIERLAIIFLEKFDLDINRLSNNFLNKDLLGREFRLVPRDLVYLVFEIEKVFNIIIPQEDIVAGNFKTFHNIVEVIESQLQKSQKAAV